MDLKFKNLVNQSTYHCLVNRYGIDWVEVLPTIVENLGNNNWKIIRPLTGGKSAAVFLVNTPNGKMVVKITPDLERSAAELAALRIFNAHQISPRVIDYQIYEHRGIKSSVLLLEFLSESISLRTQTNIQDVTDESLARLLLTITDCGKENIQVPLKPIESHLLKKLNEPYSHGSFGALQVTESERTEARILLTELAVAAKQETWIHGTLHPGNLISIEEKVLVIDPRPFIGESAYDIAELSLKWGSEKNNHRHNFSDGLIQLHALVPYLSFDIKRAESWMKILLATGA